MKPTRPNGAEILIYMCLAVCLLLVLQTLPQTGVFASPLVPVSPLPSPTPAAGPPCGELGCTVEDGVQVCRELLLNDRVPTQREFDLIDQYQCTLTGCPALNGQILTCIRPLPQPTATLEPTATPVVLESASPPEPTAMPAPSTWTDAGLWMGTYRLLVNEHGAYCVPELVGCE